MHISGPRRFKNTTKIPREDLQEREERKKIVAGEGKKSAKFWAPHPSGPHPSGFHPSGPHPSGPIFSRFGPPPFGALPSGLHFCMNCVCPQRKTGGWVGGGGGFGQSRTNLYEMFFGLSRIGLSRARPLPARMAWYAILESRMQKERRALQLLSSEVFTRAHTFSGLSFCSMASAR